MAITPASNTVPAAQKQTPIFLVFLASYMVILTEFSISNDFLRVLWNWKSFYLPWIRPSVAVQLPTPPTSLPFSHTTQPFWLPEWWQSNPPPLDWLQTIAKYLPWCVITKSIKFWLFQPLVWNWSIVQALTLFWSPPPSYQQFIFC